MQKARSPAKPTWLPIIHPFAAGIDIGSRFHVVAVSPDLCDEPVQTFQAFTSDLSLPTIGCHEFALFRESEMAVEGKAYVLEGRARQIVVGPTDLSKGHLGPRQKTDWGYDELATSNNFVGVPVQRNKLG